MKEFIILFITCFSFTFLRAQKPLIDTSVYNKWESVARANISNDGKYAMFKIGNREVDGGELVIQATNNNWKFVNAEVKSAAVITGDSKKGIFMSNDSLCIVTLGSSNVEYIPKVTSFTIAGVGKEEWLAYKLYGEQRELIIKNVKTELVKKYNNIDEYFFSDNGRFLILKEDSLDIKSVNIVDLSNNRSTLLLRGNSANNFVFDSKVTQLAFVSEEKVDGESKKSLMYYKIGLDTAVALADSFTRIDNNLGFDDISCFSKDGNYLYFKLKKIDLLKDTIQDEVNVDIWSYTDYKLQSQQLREINLLPTYAAVIKISDKHIIRLENENEAWQFSFKGDEFENISLIAHVDNEGGQSENNWNKSFKKTWYLVNSKDGKRKKIEEFDSLKNIIDCEISPEEKFIIYFDKVAKSFFTYEIATGIIRNITKGIKTDWSRAYAGLDTANSNYSSRGVAGWLSKDKLVLLFDKNDIWEIDPLGRQLPLNITNGYGRVHDIVFNMGFEEYSYRGLSVNEELVLSAFNMNNKSNGFFKKKLGRQGDPILLNMGQYIYYVPKHAGDFNGQEPIKAKNSRVYIVRRESSMDSPNYFSTSDFKSFRRLSNVQPEKKYNWLKTELHTWITLDKEVLQGVLYKPENFDSTKKYPIIFHYYEKKSDDLNGYIQPENLCGGCEINIPFYVSNGYLVFTPDIHYKRGYTGESALKAIISAAEYLYKISYVNKDKMGLQGCSFGGFETNYIVTHSKIFAAACSASGASDLISYYGDLFDNTNSQQGKFELGQYKIGTNLWQRPDFYINNSPVFKINDVTTPILIMSTRYDATVPSSQSIEFFTGLRRLGKKAWLLRYDGNHGVFGKSGLDFSIRMEQFFAHYLKDMPSPKWMIEGVPATKKGIETGLELDKTGKTPGDGLLIK